MKNFPFETTETTKTMSTCNHFLPTSIMIIFCDEKQNKLVGRQSEQRSIKAMSIMCNGRNHMGTVECVCKWLKKSRKRAQLITTTHFCYFFFVFTLLSRSKRRKNKNKSQTFLLFETKKFENKQNETARPVPVACKVTFVHAPIDVCTHIRNKSAESLS